MFTLAFETIRFFPSPDGVRGLLLRVFSFTIADEQLQTVGTYSVSEGVLTFDAHEKKRGRAMSILANALQNNLLCTVTKRPARYIDAASEVPLIGALEFGIIDRGTNVLEIRPCSGCNLACTYCSVSEGPDGPKIREMVIEKNYLLSAFDEIAAVKTEPIEVYIETQGEPLLYAEMEELIADLKERGVVQVTMVTNGTMLSEKRIDDLAAAGLDRINWSINSLDPERATQIAGRAYNLRRIKELIMYAKDKIEILMCPVIMQGVNDDEWDAFIDFAKDVKKTQPIIAFQNFLWYKGGRNPITQVGWDGFNEKLAELEEKHGTRLRVTTEDFSIVEDQTLPKPFKKKQLVEVERMFPGRMKNETFCKASGRVVKVIGRVPDKERFTVHILRDKHNVFLAKAV